MQNKPVDFDCLKEWKNRIMMNELVPKYFNLNIPKLPGKSTPKKQTKQVLTAEKPDEGLDLTERELDHLKRITETCF